MLQEENDALRPGVFPFGAKGLVIFLALSECIRPAFDRPVSARHAAHGRFFFDNSGIDELHPQLFHAVFRHFHAAVGTIHR